jgi:hypothetical protein
MFEFFFWAAMIVVLYIIIDSVRGQIKNRSKYDVG